jgi:hypothetical protein
VRLLVDGARASEAPAAAAAVGWPLPRTLAVIVAVSDDHWRLALRFGGEAIAASSDGLACLLVPDPAAPGRGAQLEAGVAELEAALGPQVPWERAGLSYARAVAALRLRQRGEIQTSGLLRAEDWLAELIVHGDPELLAELRRRRLAPLQAAGTAARPRLEETLAAWLRAQGSLAAVATELGIHRQTVRYRLARLRELLAGALDDPQARFELELALRSRTDEERN